MVSSVQMSSQLSQSEKCIYIFADPKKDNYATQCSNLQIKGQLYCMAHISPKILSIINSGYQEDEILKELQKILPMPMLESLLNKPK